MTVRILIAEAHAELRFALKAIVADEPWIEVVGEVACTGELLDLAPIVRPGVVLLDVSLPDLRGAESIRRLRQAVPDAKVLLLTGYEYRYMVRDALLAGAAGCIVSTSADSTLVSAIRAVTEDGLYVLPGVVWGLLTEDLSLSGEAHLEEAERLLTPRELEVLCLVAQGYTNRQASVELGLSVRTVETHRERIMAKLEAHSRTDLVRYAAEHHLLDGVR